VWHVFTNEQFVIPPLQKCVINGQLKGQSMPLSCVCINPVELPLQGLYAVAVILKVIGKPMLKKWKNSPELLTSETSDTGSENRKLQERTGHITLQITNATEDTIQVPGHTRLCPVGI
jgi:hypothetical protein